MSFIIENDTTFSENKFLLSDISRTFQLHFNSLAKAKNFAIRPKNIAGFGIVSAVEDTVRILPTHEGNQYVLHKN